MSNQQQVSRAYARAIGEISNELNINLSQELTKVWEAISSCNDLENLLFFDVFTLEERSETLSVILDKLQSHAVIKNFLLFLVQEKRMSIFPLIYKEIIIAEDFKDGFISGEIEGPEDKIDDQMLSKIKNYLEEKLNLKTRLDYKRNEKISAGYKVTVGDLQLDATLENQLKRFKEEVLQN